MRNISIRSFIILVSMMTVLAIQYSSAQSFKDGKLFLNDSGDQYIKLSFVSQFWLRNGQYNPGSTVFNYAKDGGTDEGIRRFRIQLLGQLSKRVFFFSQFGENNFNSISDRKVSFFAHDAHAEYAIDKGKLSIGAGLSGWSGLSRFASPSVATIMGLDAPLYQQTTNDVTDQFLRKIGVFAKGKLNHFDYRISMAQPLSFQKSPLYNATIAKNSNFSSLPPKMQWNGYFQYQFFDSESNLTPYTTGTYLGKKKVFNFGAGIVYQNKAMWHLADNKVDTISTDLMHYGVDVFYDAPISPNGASLNFYASANHLDFGPNYIRNLGVLNPTNGESDKSIINGGGFALPAYGTGNVYYLQLGYKFQDSLIGSATLMPYFSIQSAHYSGLTSTMNYYSTGVNVLLSGHKTKLTLAFENRPVYTALVEKPNRKSNIILQYQISF